MRFNIPKKPLHYALLIVEGLILLLILIAFWYHIDPRLPLRDQWYWLLWFALPIFNLRLILMGRLWTHTMFHNLIIAFIVVSAFSYENALYMRESFLAPMARPLFGMWLFVYFIELTRTTKSLKPIMIITLVLSFVLALLALTTSDWLFEKSQELWFIIEALPTFDYRQAASTLNSQLCSPLVDLINRSPCFSPSFLMANSLLKFNVNEIAGALIWLAPIMAGIAFFVPSKESDKTEYQNQSFWLGIRIIGGIIFALLCLALILGQSRFAILGLIVSLCTLGWFAFQKKVWRYLVIGFALSLIILEIILILNVFHVDNDSQGIGLDNTGATLQASQRDANSLTTRVAIWQRGVEMMLDYPLTGIGMYMYRTAVNSDAYSIDYYVQRPELSPPPHAHNAWIAVGAEVGVIGLLIFMGWQIMALWMLWYGWQNGNQIVRTTALAAFAGLLGHAVYGLGDTIALWDRFQFMQWWVYGLVGAQYVMAKLQVNEQPTDARAEMLL